MIIVLYVHKSKVWRRIMNKLTVCFLGYLAVLSFSINNIQASDPYTRSNRFSTTPSSIDPIASSMASNQKIDELRASIAQKGTDIANIEHLTSAKIISDVFIIQDHPEHFKPKHILQAHLQKIYDRYCDYYLSVERKALTGMDLYQHSYLGQYAKHNLNVLRDGAQNPEQYDWHSAKTESVFYGFRNDRHRFSTLIVPKHAETTAETTPEVQQ